MPDDETSVDEKKPDPADLSPRQPRSGRKRGPKAAAAAGPQRSPGRRRRLEATPDGGFAAGDADRHLLNYRQRTAAGEQDDTYFRITRALVVAARRWRKVANDRIKATGQTMARWETLFLVGFSDEELTQRQLARLISVEGPTMVRMLDLLARDGLIERQQNEVDRRVTCNRITPAGLEVTDTLMAITNQLRAELLADIDPAKLATATEVLGTILGKLDTMR